MPSIEITLSKHQLKDHDVECSKWCVCRFYAPKIRQDKKVCVREINIEAN